MGATYRFQCSQCNYQAAVSGGADIGFIVRTQTVFCFDCDELHDMVTEYWATEYMTARERAKLDQKRVGCCPKCSGHELAAWDDGDPCPRCNSEMPRIALIMDWD